jgi:hypothetical protein
MPITLFSKALFSKVKKNSTKKIYSSPTNNKIENFFLKHKIKTIQEIKNSTKIMENSLKLMELAMKNFKSPFECPNGITKEMLLTELDCEDLRSMKKKPSLEELWNSYYQNQRSIFASLDKNDKYVIQSTKDKDIQSALDLFRPLKK